MANLQYRFGELRAVPEDDSRTVEFIISNEMRDRHGTVLRANKWNLENYKKNPVVSYNHSLHGGMFTEAGPDTVIGTSEVFFEGKNLIGRVTFEPEDLNPLAEKVYRKIKFGSLRTASVGFVPLGEPEYGKGDEARGKENETMYFPGQELLEWSVVNIPSNPSAAKREFTDESEKFLEAAAKTLEDKYTIEELRKMTMKGIMSLMSGEGVEEDKKEADDSQKIEDEKVQRELMRVKMDLAYHHDFEMSVSLKEEKEKEAAKKQLNVHRLNVHKFYEKNNKEKDDDKK